MCSLSQERADRSSRKLQNSRESLSSPTHIMGDTLPSSQARAARRKRQRNIISLDLLLDYALCTGLCSDRKGFKTSKNVALLACTGGRRNLLLAADPRGSASALAINPIVARSASPISLSVCSLTCMASHRRCLELRELHLRARRAFGGLDRRCYDRRGLQTKGEGDLWRFCVPELWKVQMWGQCMV